MWFSVVVTIVISSNGLFNPFSLIQLFAGNLGDTLSEANNFKSMKRAAKTIVEYYLNQFIELFNVFLE